MPSTPRMPSTTQPGTTAPGMPSTPRMPSTTQPGTTAPGMPSTTQPSTTAPGMPFTPQSGMTPSGSIYYSNTNAGSLLNNGNYMPFESYTPNGYMNMKPYINQNTSQCKNQGMPYIYYPQNLPYNNQCMPDENPYTVPMGIPLLPIYGYDNSADFDRDMENMRRIYPNTLLLIQPHVEEECDKLEYDGSVMFDEYPDKVTIDRIVDRIYEKVKNNDEEFPVQTENIYQQPRRRNNFFRDIITVTLLNEFLNRRRRRRSRRRWF
jgi:hypothetical protein